MKKKRQKSDFQVAAEFRDTRIPDGMLNGYPVWHGHIIIRAFMVGMQHQRKKDRARRNAKGRKTR